MPGTASVLTGLTKAVKPPAGGWTADAFRENGVALIKTLTTTAKVVQRKAKPVIQKIVRDTLNRQLEQIIELALRRAGSRSWKQSIEISHLAQEELWAQALKDVIDEQRLDIAVDLVPPIQSVMAQGFSKTGAMMGLPADAVPGSAFAAKARSVATRITKISDTTRKDFERVIRGAIEEDLTVTETAKRLKAQMPQIAARRQETIARTETMLAWTEGSVASMQQSGVILEVDVIGCESREEERWSSPSFQQFMYRGEGTCNIKAVPIGDADKLNFHPNHTGVVVPSKFREEGGGAPDLGTGLPAEKNEEEKQLLGQIQTAQKDNGGLDWIPAKKQGLTVDEEAARRAFPEKAYVAKVNDFVDEQRSTMAELNPKDWPTAELNLSEIHSATTKLDVSKLKQRAGWVTEPDPVRDAIVVIRRQGKLWASDAEQLAIARMRGETKAKVVVFDAPRRGQTMGKVARMEAGDLKPTGASATAYSEGFKVIDQVIETPENVIGFNAGARPLRDLDTSGSYLPGFRSIRLNTAYKGAPEAKANTVIHEAGHWLDDVIFGGGANLGHKFGRDAQELMTAFRNTEAYKTLKRTSSREYFAYAGSPVEVFARGFNQYVTEKAGTDAMKKVLKQRTWNGFQWTESDFAPVRKVIEEQLKRANLLR